MSTETVQTSLPDMAEAGVHIGHVTSKWHPQMAEYIYTSKNDLHIINLEATEACFKDAAHFIRRVTSEGKDIMFVATKKQTVDVVKTTAESVGMPYMVKRWVGGTFTNFDVVSKRVKHINDLERQLENGELNQYTKRERLGFQQEIEKANGLFGGIREMETLPGAILVEDVQKDMLAVQEAHDVGIPVIALTDTNVNPDLVDYPIPANDDALAAVEYMYAKIAEVIKSAQAQ
jgi:small subunit ribosomal protein S2